MNLVLLGAGKTGSVVAGVADERGHRMKIVEIDENPDGPRSPVPRWPEWMR